MSDTMSDPKLTQQELRVLDAVDALADEMVAFCQELVRIPTVNPPGDYYADCSALIAQKLRDFGYEVAVIPAEGHREHTRAHPRINVTGRLEGTSARPCLHFNGHYDVVPPGSGWTVDPFGGVIRDGRLYGRGEL